MSALEDLELIAKILDNYGSRADLLAMVRRIYECLEFDSTPLMWDVKLQLEERRRYSDIGEVTLLDLVLNCLKFEARHDIALELQTRIESCLQRIRDWEICWRTRIKTFGKDAESVRGHSGRIEAADYLGRVSGETEYAAIEQFEEVRAVFSGTATWIRQFVVMQRNRIGDLLSAEDVSDSHPGVTSGSDVTVVDEHQAAKQTLLTKVDECSPQGRRLVHAILRIPGLRIAREELAQVLFGETFTEAKGKLESAVVRTNEKLKQIGVPYHFRFEGGEIVVCSCRYMKKKPEKHRSKMNLKNIRK